MRDWLNTLWDASYKGVPFLVEKDNESGSRRIKPHEFPMRDRPFLEDLGEGLRRYNLTAYVASDQADSEASAVMEICATRGPGLLVLPTHGPLMVRAIEFERDRDKDKHGYIGHRLSFLREGESLALASVNVLSNSVFVAIDSLAAQVATSFVGELLRLAQPDFVIDAAINGMLDNVAMVEGLRTTLPLPSALSSAQRTEINALYADMSEIIVGDNPADAPARIVASVRAIAAAADPALALSSLEQLLSGMPQAKIIVPQDYRTPRRVSEAINAEEAARVMRLATVGAYCEAVALIPLADRQAALTLRANVVEFLDAEIEATNAADYGLYNALVGARDATVNYLSRSVLDLAPVRKIDANQSMPAVYWAWRLYKDPNRQMEIVNRNRVADPLFIPPQFEALVS